MLFLDDEVGQMFWMLYPCTYLLLMYSEGVSAYLPVPAFCHIEYSAPVALGAKKSMVLNRLND